MKADEAKDKGVVQLIYGIPFGPDPKHPHLADWAQCQLCGDVVDVGGELRRHVEWHQDLRREMEGERW